MLNKSLTVVSTFVLIAVGVFALFMVPPQAEATELEAPGYALIAAPVFGLNDHLDEAENLRSYLLAHGWTDESIIYLADSSETYMDGDATKDAIEDAIADIANDATENDIVFISVLDHAQKGEDNHTYFRTGDPGDPTYFSDTEFAGWVDDITDFSTMVIYISCPYSGGFVSELEGEGRIVIADCGATQTYTSCEYTFYQALTEEDADTDEDGKVSVEEAYTYMEDYMEVQDPVIYDYQDEEIFL